MCTLFMNKKISATAHKFTFWMAAGDFFGWVTFLRTGVLCDIILAQGARLLKSYSLRHKCSQLFNTEEFPQNATSPSTEGQAHCTASRRPLLLSCPGVFFSASVFWTWECLTEKAIYSPALLNAV